MLRVPFEAKAHEQSLLGLGIAGSNDAGSPVCGRDALVGDAVDFRQPEVFFPRRRSIPRLVAFMGECSGFFHGLRHFCAFAVIIFRDNAEHGAQRIAASVGLCGAIALRISLGQREDMLRSLPANTQEDLVYLMITAIQTVKKSRTAT